jgi:hypothetical protein
MCDEVRCLNSSGWCIVTVMNMGEAACSGSSRRGRQTGIVGAAYRRRPSAASTPRGPWLAPPAVARAARKLGSERRRN